MNLDLFADDRTASPIEYQHAMAAWLVASAQAGQLQRESSTDVYEHMWNALTAWAVGHGIRLTAISAADLDAYLRSRGGSEELSPRYAWRLLRIVDRVLSHHTRVHDLPPNRAAIEFMASRPDIRFANSSDTDPLPDFLPASEAKRLVTYLSAVRPGRAPAAPPWQEVRNRASVGLMLGAGLTPGEVRALTLAAAVSDGGTTKGTPCP